MIAALKAEFRKILTVRSTYVIALLILALSIGLISFWIYGYKDAEQAAQSTKVLLNTITTAVAFGSVIAAFIALLSAGHEYRYNTILYSLTTINSRTKMLVAKWTATVVVTLLISAGVALLSWAAFYLGQSIGGTNTMPQVVPIGETVWQLAATVVGTTSFAFIMVILLRSFVGAIALFLLLPSTIEGLLSMAIKDNARFLPFMSLSAITAPTDLMSSLTALAVVSAYVVGFGTLGWLLFLRRDAN